MVEVVTIREGGAAREAEGEIPSSMAVTVTISDGESMSDVDARDLRTMVVLRAIVPSLQS